MTDDFLRKCCSQGMSDAAIGSLCGMTGEGIAYRRKKIGISVEDKYNARKEHIDFLEQVNIHVLCRDYYSLTQEKFSERYKVSKTVWRRVLKERGVLSKRVHRDNSYSSFSSEQRALLIGSLLGDGSVSQRDFFYESHSLKQRLYLQKKCDILKPYSKDPYYCDHGKGLRFKTAHHPNFQEFYKVFYSENVRGKLIPVEFIKNNWSDVILAYWYFDDGYYDRRRNELTIANKCPYYYMLERLVQFLDDHFRWNFSIWKKGGMFHVTFSKKYYADFSRLLVQNASPDLFYKIPKTS